MVHTILSIHAPRLHLDSHIAISHLEDAEVCEPKEVCLVIDKGEGGTCYNLTPSTGAGIIIGGVAVPIALF